MASSDQTTPRSLVGLSVHHLCHGLVKEMEEEGLKRDSTIKAIAAPIIIKRSASVICPRDGRSGAAYVDCFDNPEIAGHAVVMLSYSWGYYVSDIVDTLWSHCMDNGWDVKSTYVWMCCFCINQHRVKEKRANGENVSFDEFQRAFSSRISGIGNVIAMMAPWREPGYITRVWCVFEFFFVKNQSDSKLTICMPPREKESLMTALKDGTGLQEIWEALMRLDIQKASASVESDRQSIFRMIEEKGGFDQINNVVSECLRTWLVQSTQDYVLSLNSVEKLKAEDVGIHDAIDLCNQVGMFHEGLHKYDEAIKFYEQGWSLWQTTAAQGADLLVKIGRANCCAKDPDQQKVMDYYQQALNLFQDSGTCETEEYADLLRNIGVWAKHTGNIQEALERYEQAQGLRTKLGQLESQDGAKLLVNIGALHYEKGDLDMALQAYMESLKILQKMRGEDTPQGATLLTNIGIVKVATGDLESALDLFNRAKLIRMRTGSWDSKRGIYLDKCIKEAESLQLKQKVLDIFEAQDPDQSSVVPKQALIRFCELLMPEDDVVKQHRAQQFVDVVPAAGESQGVEYHEFMNELFKSNESPFTYQSRELGKTPTSPMIINPEAPRADVGSFTVMAWNMMSPDFAANALEYLPNERSLPQKVRATLRDALQGARRIMVCPDTSPTLGDLLGDKPLIFAQESPFETAPLSDQDEKSLNGVREWLQSRAKQWVPFWGDLSTDSVAERWCADYTFRWDFWKRQTVHEWLCDDGSGGITNPLMLPRKPVIDEMCWDLGISTADRKYPNRSKRCRWIVSTEDVPPKGVGKHDFFKLLVFDLVICHILEEQPAEAVDSLLAALRPMSANERMLRIEQRCHDADIVILVEAPRELNTGFEDFWIVRSSATTTQLNTVILARRAMFDEPVQQDFSRCAEGAANARVVGCTLRRKTDGQELKVIGVHLSVKGYDTKHIAKELDRAITPRTILGGDFNIDLRKGKCTDWDHLPRLKALCEQAKDIPVDLGSTSKERSPFQAQISKMFLPEFSLKDYLLTAENLFVTRRRGMIYRSQRLPDCDTPSDHAPITAQMRFQE